ncbi:MAG: VanZ family protein [Candidatus Omnitrophica bacterium]|nr:VanZ family protein [Candidatus Omnitrophota bacterium]
MPDKSGYIRFLKFWLPVYLYAGLIFIYSAQSSVAFVPEILYGDKLLHFVEYAILGYLIARAAKNSSSLQLRAHFRIFAVSLASLYGLSDEFHQYFVPGREVEILDALADAAGAVFGQMFLRA